MKVDSLKQITGTEQTIEKEYYAFDINEGKLYYYVVVKSQYIDNGNVYNYLLDYRTEIKEAE